MRSAPTHWRGGTWCWALAQRNLEFVHHDSLVVAILSVADDNVVDEGELVGVDAVVAEVPLGQTLLADLRLAVLAGGITPTIQQRLAETFNTEDFFVRILAGHQEPWLGTGVQAVVHTVLRQAIGYSLGGLQVDVDMHVLDEHLHRPHRALGGLGQLSAEPQGLAVGDAPRLDVVFGGVVHGQRDVLARDLGGH